MFFGSWNRGEAYKGVEGSGCRQLAELSVDSSQGLPIIIQLILGMDRNTPKSFRSIAEKSRLLASTPSYFDRDVQMEQEYLEKLKTQRIKAQKLYTEYKAILKDRDKVKEENLELQKQLEVLRKKCEEANQQTKSEIIKLTYTNERIEAENRTLRSEQMEYYTFKHRFNDMEKRIEMNQLERQQQLQTVERLEEDIHRLEIENRRLREELEQEAEAMRSKYLRSESNRQRLQKEYQRQKQAYSKNKSLWDQEREQITQTLTLKTQQLNTIKSDYQNQLKEKDRLYQIAVAELQQNKMFWRVKIDEKNREVTSLKKSLQNEKQQCKKWKTQSQKEKERYKDYQDRQKQLRQSVDQISVKLRNKEMEYTQLHSRYVRTIDDAQRLETRIQELQKNLKKCQQTNKQLVLVCEEYQRVIEKMERDEKRRLQMTESQYEEIDRMEQIFASLQ